MRLRELAFALICVSVLTACSSLMVPTYRKQGAEWIAPVYHVTDNGNSKKRMAAERRLGLAQKSLASGDLKNAESEAAAVLKENPGSTDALTFLAVIAGQKGASDQAGAYYKRAADFAPKRGDVANNYGAWLCSTGHQAEALVWFDRALEDPNYANPASALANAGGCALEAGQYERGERDLRRALAIDPSNAYALVSMAKNEYRQNRYFEARAFTERRLSAAPADPAVLQLASNIEERLGDKAAASRYVQRLRAEFPDSSPRTPGK